MIKFQIGVQLIVIHICSILTNEFFSFLWLTLSTAFPANATIMKLTEAHANPRKELTLFEYPFHIFLSMAIEVIKAEEVIMNVAASYVHSVSASPHQIQKSWCSPGGTLEARPISAFQKLDKPTNPKPRLRTRCPTPRSRTAHRYV